MKIEKISDNQIRCTLNRADLAERQLKISELAYGSEKAKELFREMMQQASYEFGFEAEDIPLMIEAIPMSPDCIVLIITKVEDPDELDTRFSKFAPGMSEDDEDEDDEEYDEDDSLSDDTLSISDKKPSSGADEILNLFNKVKDYLNKNLSELDENVKSGFVPLGKSLKESSKANDASKDGNPLEQAMMDNLDKMESIDGSPREASIQKETNDDSFEINMVKLFSFTDIKAVTQVAKIISKMYDGINSLFYDEAKKKYYLQLYKSSCDPVAYNKVCNILSEYGDRESTNYARLAYFVENTRTIAKDNAIQTLAAL